MTEYIFFLLTRMLPVMIMIGTFIANCFFKVNIAVIILCGGAVGAADMLFKNKKGKTGERN